MRAPKLAPEEGMKQRAIVTSHRQKMWLSMRILRKFTIPDVLRTAPPAKIENAYKFFGRLEAAGIIGKVGDFTAGRAGEYQRFVLLKDMGPYSALGKGEVVSQRIGGANG